MCPVSTLFNSMYESISIRFRIHNRFVMKKAWSVSLPSILLPFLKVSFPWLAFPFFLPLRELLCFGWFAFFPVNAWLLLIARRSASASLLAFRSRAEIPRIIFYSLIRRFRNYWILIWLVLTRLPMIAKISNLI